MQTLSREDCGAQTSDDYRRYLSAMPFQFTLATVLQYKESVEQREEHALKEIQLKMAHVARQIEELNATIENAHTARERAMERPIPGSHLQVLVSGANATIENRKTLIVSLQKLEKQRDEQMKKYEVAHRNREMLTDIQDKQRSIFDLEQNRAQQKRLDDIFMSRRKRG
jgi:flagellar export protein FliJ